MKTAFITGANRGLGYGFVQYLLSEGYTVFGGTRKIHDDLPSHKNLIWIECDVQNDASIEKAVKSVAEKTESIDLLVNNAGTNKDTIPQGDKDLVSKLGSLDRAALLDMFDINTVSPIILTQEFVGLLKANPSFVINISSARASFSDGHAGSTANYGYAASKVALNMMTFCSEAELPENVKTFAVHPGGVLTDMNPDAQKQPIEQAKAIVSITENWNDSLNGKFLNYSGSLYPL
ncbi:MAG: csgA [Parcubacteria group bacterium]|nr:csgA [Parcubacteria group bacterium]